MNISTYTFRVLDCLIPMYPNEDGFYRLNSVAKKAGVSPHYVRLLIAQGLAMRQSEFKVNRNNPVIKISSEGYWLWDRLIPNVDDIEHVEYGEEYYGHAPIREATG